MTPRNPAEKAEFRTSPLLDRAGFRHAFFTRNGGASAGAYASLNFSVAVGDAEDAVAANLERAAAALGVASNRIYFLSQVHGHHAHQVRGDEDRRSVVLVEGDALAGRSPGSAISVRIADCVPILVGDRRSGAVVAIHAGWKGLVQNVIAAGVAKLRDIAGKPLDAVAAIGPHIRVGAFEVSEDVAKTLAECSTAKDVVERSYGAKPHVDLARIASAQLALAGLSPDSIDDVPGCTHRDSADFFSFRRDGAKSGRHLASIVPLSRGTPP